MAGGRRSGRRSTVIGAAALLGGLGLYLLGHVAFAWRDNGTIKVARLLGAAAMVATVPLARAGRPATTADGRGAAGDSNW